MRRLCRLPISPSVTLAVIVLVVSCQIAAGQCTSCATEITLRKADWGCLQNKLEGYLNEPSDPVIVSLHNCGSRSPDELRAPTMPPISPAGRATNSPQPRRIKLVLILSKAQLACIRSRIAAIQRNPSDPVTFALRECERE